MANKFKCDVSEDAEVSGSFIFKGMMEILDGSRDHVGQKTSVEVIQYRHGQIKLTRYLGGGASNSQYVTTKEPHLAKRGDKTVVLWEGNIFGPGTGGDSRRSEIWRVKE